MRNLKKVLSLTLALVMLIGMMVVGAGAATTEFTDVNAENKEEAIKVMSAVEVFVGNGDGTFNPDGNLTRAEASTLILRMSAGNAVENAVKGSSSLASNFTDVEAGEWYTPYIAYATNMGWVNGNGDGTFNPDGNVTGYEFGKMLLGVLGYTKEEERYTKALSWELKVLDDMVKTMGNTANQPSMLSGLENVDLSKPLTREQAAQMALNAAQRETVNYNNTTSILVASGQTLIADNSARFGKSGEHLRKDDTAGLVDEYGHPIAQWIIGPNATKTVVCASSAATADWSSEGKNVSAADIKTALDALGITKVKTSGGSQALTLDSADSDAIKVVDGTTAAELGITTDTNGHAALAALAVENSTVEIYAEDGVITKVLVIKNYLDTVSTVADDGKITVATMEKAAEVGAYEQGDVVVYTKGYKNGAAVLTSVEKVEPAFTATATSVGKASGIDVVTIDGEKYAVSNIDGRGISDITTAPVGTEQHWYLDSYGKVMKVVAVDGSAPATQYDGYVYVKAVDVKRNAVPATFPNPAMVTVTAQVQVVTSDGEAKVFDLPMAKATLKVKNGAVADDGTDTECWTYTIGGEKQLLETVLNVEGRAADNTVTPPVTAVTAKTSDELTATLGGALSGIFPYTLSDNNIILGAKLVAATTNAPSASETVLWTMKGSTTLDKSGVSVTATLTTGGDTAAIVNNNTVFVGVTGTGATLKGDAKTGAASLDGTTIVDATVTPNADQGQRKVLGAIVDVVKGGTAEAPTYTRTVKYVFFDGTFKAASGTTQTDVIYVTGDYSKVVNPAANNDSSKAFIYTYTAYTLDGAEIEVTKIAADNQGDTTTAGLYKYNSKKELGVAADNRGDGKVTSVDAGVATLVKGNTTTIASVSENIKIVDLTGKGVTELKAGVEGYYVLTDNSLTIFFVTKA